MAETGAPDLSFKNELSFAVRGKEGTTGKAAAKGGLRGIAAGEEIW